MKLLYISFLFVSFSAFVFSCSTDKSNSQKDQKIISSPLFSFHESGDYRLIHVFNDITHQDTLCTYVLYHRGNPRPQLSVPALYVETPIESVACLSNIYVGALMRLGLKDKIVAVDNGKNIFDPSVRDEVKRGKIQEIAVGDELDIERTVSLKPGIVFRYGSGDINKDLPAKLLEASVPVAVTLEFRETDPLLRASWLKFVAAFFEKEKLADSILKQTSDSYYHLKQLTDTIAFRPTVFTEILYQHTWFIPGGKSYLATLLKDAGATYLWQDDTHEGSLPLSYESVFARASNADFWLHVQYWKSKSDVIRLDDRNSMFRAYQENRIYNNDLRLSAEGAFDYWETGWISPDVVLKDLIKIFHPKILPNHSFTYYRKLN